MTEEGAWWFVVGWMFALSVGFMYVIAIALALNRRLMALEIVAHTHVVQQRANDDE